MRPQILPPDGVIVFLAALVLGLLWWTAFFEPRFYKFRKRRVRLSKKIPKPLNILHLSDIHFSGENPFLESFFDKLGEETHDFIFLTGDIFDSPEGIPQSVRNLKKLKAHFGIFSVLGNHDYFDYHLWDVFFHSFPGQGRPLRKQPDQDFQKALESAGVRVLRNQTLRVRFGEVSALIHGLDDPTTGRADVGATFKGSEGTGEVRFLLSHSVDAMLRVQKNEIDVCFSGHSHGGQVRLPFFGALITHTTLGRKFAGGLHSFKGTFCSISQGVGTSRFFGIRFLCRPEAVTLVVEGA